MAKNDQKIFKFKIKKKSSNSRKLTFWKMGHFTRLHRALSLQNLKNEEKKLNFAKGRVLG